jgi:cardiolipin synthase
MDPTGGDRTPASDRVLTLPNVISFARIAMIPLVWALIVDEDTSTVGVVVFVVVLATDWVDGTIARRTGQVSDVGKVLDPLADRTVIAMGLLALVVRGAFPAWAAASILVRDLAVIAAWALLVGRGIRLQVRWIGKVATFALMVGIPSIAWGSLGAWPAEAALAVGWLAFAIGVVEYYVAAAVYAADMRRALVHR